MRTNEGLFFGALTTVDPRQAIVSTNESARGWVVRSARTRHRARTSISTHILALRCVAENTTPTTADDHVTLGLSAVGDDLGVCHGDIAATSALGGDIGLVEILRSNECGMRAQHCNHDVVRSCN